MTIPTSREEPEQFATDAPRPDALGVRQLQPPRWRSALIDGAAAAAFTALTVRSSRSWGRDAHVAT
jgi:hypothetical protein